MVKTFQLVFLWQYVHTLLHFCTKSLEFAQSVVGNEVLLTANHFVVIYDPLSDERFVYTELETIYSQQKCITNKHKLSI